jgi:MFS-type transporter involved in bile tolerance (Atg22 family)
LRWTTRLVLGVLVLTIALDVVAIVSELSYHSLIERASNGGDVSLAQFQSADDRQNAIDYVGIGITVAAVIFFIAWFSRAYKNLGRLAWRACAGVRAGQSARGSSPS